MVLLAVCCYVYSIVQFLKMVVQILAHDAGSVFFGDYDSPGRSRQRGGALKSFAKCFLGFALGGFFMMMNI